MGDCGEGTERRCLVGNFLLERLVGAHLVIPPKKWEQLLLVAEILHQLRLVVYPIIYKVLYIPGGVGFQPSTV